MDIVFDLEKSDYLKHRSQLMRSLEIPKLSDATAILGEPLAKIVFEECDDALKVDFGLEPPLKGPLEDLWVSPSDLLLGKVALKPPYTRKHIQALTHEGIMSIGIGIERKFLNEVKKTRDTALANQKKDLLHGFEDYIKAEIKDVEARERAACQREMERISQEFESKLIEQLDALEASLRKEYETTSEGQEAMLQRKWEKKLNKEVQRTTKKLTEEFVDECIRQEEVLTKHFRNDLMKKDMQKQFDMEQQKFEYQKNVDQLKHNLECKNIANMMYILCMERRKCCDEKDNLEKYYKNKLDDLNKIVAQRDSKIVTLNNKMIQQMKKVDLREKCILEVIKEFQKFINFALRSAPTQAEFLLSVEKMMLFELTEAIAKVDVNRLVPCEETLPWPTVTELPKGEIVPGLEIADNHNCFNELPVPVIEGEGFLPAFKFKNKLYVREDFRNMINKGIEITRSNELWNEDVQILMDTLKKSVSGEQIDDAMMRRSTQTSILNKKLDRKTSKKSLKGHIRSSNIQFKLDKSIEEADKAKRVSLNEGTISSSLRKLGFPAVRSSLRVTQGSLPPINFGDIGKAEHTSRLLAAKSSLELLIKKGSVRYLGSKTIEEIDAQEDRPSIYEYKKPDLDSNNYDTNSTLDEVRHASVRKSSDVSYKLVVKDNKDPGMALFEFKNNIDMSVQSETIPPELVLDTRDSIILRKASLTKDNVDFVAEPRDSVELKKESLVDLKQKPSKLVMARDSVQLLRESKILLRDSSVCPKKGPQRSRSRMSWAGSKDNCCDSKCAKPKIESTETLTGIPKKPKQDDKAIKVSHIEVIPMKEEEQNKSVVSFHPVPTVYEDGEESDTKLLEKKLYTKTKTIEKPKQKSIKDKFVSLPRKVGVVGDPRAKEYLQNTNEFTADRIHSFISLIKDHPSLIRTFTACRR